MNVEVRVIVLVTHLTLAVFGGTDLSHCTRYAEYNTLVNLMKHDQCMDVDTVFKLLVTLGVKDSSSACRNHVVHILADHFGHDAQTPAHCQCQGVNKLQQYHIGGGDGVADHRRFCLLHNPPYNDMYHQFFESKNIHNKTVACRTHYSVWSVLKNITSSGSGHNPCQKDIIYHLKYAYDHYPDNCTCTVPSSVLPSASISTSKVPTPAVTTHTTSSTKAPSPVITTHSTVPTSPYASGTSTESARSSMSVKSTHKPIPTIKFSCDKLKVVEDIAKSLRTTHPNSSACLPDDGGSDDAYVLSTCNTTLPMMWQKGVNVMADCESNTQLIPTYTPVSTFDGGSYTSIGAQPGIFLGCYNSGIKIAIQKCNGIPEIVNIEHGVFVNDPKKYYVIV